MKLFSFVIVGSLAFSMQVSAQYLQPDPEPIIIEEEKDLQPLQAPAQKHQVQKNIQAPFQKNIQAPIQKGSVQFRERDHRVLPFRERRVERRRARLELLDG